MNEKELSFSFISFLSIQAVQQLKQHILRPQQLFLQYQYSMKRNVYSNHRENSPDYYRQSLAILPSQLLRNSFNDSSKAPQLYRQSYCPVSRPRQTNASTISLKKRTEPITRQLKNNTFNNLKSTLGDLQRKINFAKHKLNSYKNILEEQDYIQINNKIDEIQEYNQKDQSIFSLESTIVETQAKILFQRRHNSGQRLITSKTYYLNHLVEAIQGLDNRALEHLILSLKGFQNRHKITSPSFSQIEEKKVFLSQKKQHIGKKTLVLDIDQTLIRCQQQKPSSYDLQIPVEVESGARVKAYITIRPYAISFLKRMSKYYEIIAFTASHQSYADVVLNEIDPDKEFIQHRLYRKNCIEIYPNIFAKDLRIINRDLNSIVLVDNAPYSYIFQLQNGIPILPYYSGQDNELLLLQKYLQEMHKCSDVRQHNKKYFKLHKYGDYKDLETLVEKLFVS